MKSKLLIVTLAIIIFALVFAQVKIVRAENVLQTFYSEKEAGIFIRIDATPETVPGGNMTITTWVNCTTDDGILVEQFNMTIYGFEGGANKTQLATMNIIENMTLAYHSTNESNYTLTVPNDVWDATYADLHLKYVNDNSVIECDPSFALTVVTNVYYEQLKQDFSNLNNSYIQLNGTYWQLNGTYTQLNGTYSQLNASYSQLNDAYNELNSAYSTLNSNYSELRDTYDQLNQTYFDLQRNYTQLQGSVNDLNNTRQLATVLGVTSIFFVATTVYLATRRPKTTW